MRELKACAMHELDNATIEKEITRISAGNYILYRENLITSKPVIKYVGRSDNNVADRLKKWVNHERRYRWFTYRYAVSPEEAFEKECKDFHKYNPRHNAIHPDRPENSEIKCPVPGCEQHSNS